MTEDPGKIVIIGGTGQTGRPVLGALASRGAKVTALVRSAASAQKALQSGAADTVEADLNSPGSLEAAFVGAYTVHLIPPLFDAGEDVLVEGAVRAAERAGVTRFVFHSALHPATPDLPHHERKARAEAILRDSALVWTTLQFGMYLNTVAVYLDAAGGDEIGVPYDLESPFTVIDINDVAEITAIVLTEPGHEYAVYPLVGTERHTMRELIEELGSAFGRTVRAVKVTPDALPKRPGWSDSAYDDLKAMWAHYDGHGLMGNRSIARMILGREPSTLARAAASLAARRAGS